MSDRDDSVDFAVAAYREEGSWQVQKLTHEVLADVETLAHGLRRFPGDSGALAFVGVDEDFLVVVRVSGSTTQVLLSDVTAADEWELAASALDHLHLPMPEDDDDQVPAGDIGLLTDLGMNAVDLAVLLDDVDLYPDEIVSEVARVLGFGELFDDVVGLASA